NSRMSSWYVSAQLTALIPLCSTSSSRGNSPIGFKSATVIFWGLKDVAFISASVIEKLFFDVVCAPGLSGLGLCPRSQGFLLGQTLQRFADRTGQAQDMRTFI